MLDLRFNLAMLVVDAAALVWISRRPEPWRLGLAIAGLGAVASLLGLTLSQNVFHLMRLAAAAIFAHVPLLLVGGVRLLGREHARVRIACGVAALALLAVATYAFLIEPTRLEVSRHRIESPRVTRPVRIAVVADIQTDRVGPYERRALRRLVDESPDLVLMPGDYVHEIDPLRRERVGRELRAQMLELGLDAPLGVYAVGGNTDHPDWVRIFEGLPVTAVTRSARFDVGELSISALDTVDSADTTLRVERRGDSFAIAFGHYPDFALGEIHADLLVAGHTHGGQVRLPLVGPLITFSRVPRSWAAGLTRLSGGRTLVVSRGIGMERGLAPRLRFLCRPEIVVIEVVPED